MADCVGFWDTQDTSYRKRPTGRCRPHVVQPSRTLSTQPKSRLSTTSQSKKQRMPNRCAVANCNNDRRYPNRYIIMPHVGPMKFFGPKQHEFGRWQCKLQRTGGFEVKKSTVVCSNHFRYGLATEKSRIPELYLRGYPAWALSVEDSLQRFRSLSNPDTQSSILQDVAATLHADVAQEFVKYELLSHELPLELRTQAIESTQQTAHAILSSAVQHLSDYAIQKLLHKISDLLYPGVILGSLAKYVLAPGSEVYTGNFHKTSRSSTTSQPLYNPSSLPLPNLQDSTSYPESPGISIAATSSPPTKRHKAEQNNTENHLNNINLFHSYCMQTETTILNNNDDYLIQSPLKSKACKRVHCVGGRKRLKIQHKSIKALKKKLSDAEHKQQMLSEELIQYKTKSDTLTTEVKRLKQELQLHRVMTIDKIKHNDNLVNLHTGLPSYNHFVYIYEIVEAPATNMQYWRGSSNSSNMKSYQLRNKKKPGRPLQVSLPDQLLMTLMKLRLNLSEPYLGFLFNVQESTVSKIFSTWLLLLNEELKPIIHWPSVEEVQTNQPACYHKWGGRVRAIIDCTEVPINRPSLAEANTKTFSAYKNTTTVKFLIACTPQGTISFVSPPAGGRMTDQAMVDKCHLVEKFAPGDICMADKGFRIQHLLLDGGVELVIPPFTRQGKPFTVDKARKNKEIANARIHIERVIGRMKDFKLFQGPIPLTLFDMTGPIANVCAALVNLNDPIVPME